MLPGLPPYVVELLSAISRVGVPSAACAVALEPGGVPGIEHRKVGSSIEVATAEAVSAESVEECYEIAKFVRLRSGVERGTLIESVEQAVKTGNSDLLQIAAHTKSSGEGCAVGFGKHTCRATRSCLLRPAKIR